MGNNALASGCPTRYAMKRWQVVAWLAPGLHEYSASRADVSKIALRALSPSIRPSLSPNPRDSVPHLICGFSAVRDPAHHKEHVSGGAGPDRPDRVLLSRLGGTDQVLSLVFHYEYAAVMELRDEVGIEASTDPRQRE